MRKTLNYVLIFAFLFQLCACESAEAPPQSSPTWQEQYDLGMRYLSEGNYEEAIIAFTAAIEIDPERAEAYVGRGDAYIFSGKTEENLMAARADYEKAIELDETLVNVYLSLADVYIQLGDSEAAVDLLERGLEATGNMTLRDALDEVSGVFTMDEMAPGMSEYTALEDFLAQFMAFYPEDYDSKTAAVGDEGARNILERMLTIPSCYCYNDAIYPGRAMEIVWDGPDPLRGWESYGKVHAEKMDWLLKNIFNCSPKSIVEMKEPIMSGRDEDIYYLDGYYYFYVGGIGGGAVAQVTHIERSGMRYYVEYDLYEYGESEPYCAEVSLKNIDGAEYWSLYYNRKAVGESHGSTSAPSGTNGIEDLSNDFDTADNLRKILINQLGDITIADFCESDYDFDGKTEAFAIVGDTDEWGVCYGSLYFVTQSEVELVIDGEGFQIYDEANHLLNLENSRFYVVGQYFATGDATYVFGVSSGKWYEDPISSRGMRLTQISGSNDLQIIQSAYDYLADGTGHTWKPYYLYWDNGFHEYGGIIIGADDFLLCDGSNEIYKQIIDKGYSITNIIYRANGIININYTDGESNLNATALLKDSKVTLLNNNDYGNDALEHSNYGGIYATAFFSDIATYPIMFPLS